MKNEPNPTKMPRLNTGQRLLKRSVVEAVPNDDIPFIFHHEEVHAMIFTHKRMWNEVQKHVREQPARLGGSRVSYSGLKTLDLRHQDEQQVENIQQMRSWYSRYLHLFVRVWMRG